MKLERIGFALAATGLTVMSMAAIAGAQSAPPAPPRGPEPNVFYRAVPPAEGGGMAGFSYIGFEMGPYSKPVKGAPYSAETTTETTQVLTDGNHIYRKILGRVYRDSEGRTRRENTVPGIASLTVEGEAPRFVSIFDPVTGVRYMLDQHEKVARKTLMHSGERLRGNFPKPIGGPASAQSRTESLGKAEGGLALAQPQIESLGKQSFDGIEAEGTRTTVTIPAGKIGNELPIVIVSERWYSADLQAVVMSRQHDPRLGETVFRLTNIRREEQPVSLFEVPPGYTIQDGPDREKMIMRQPMLPGPPPPGDEF